MGVMNMYTRLPIVLLLIGIASAQTPLNLTEVQQREILFDLAELKSMESEIQSWHSRMLQDVNEELRKRQTVILQKKAALEKRVKDLGIPDDQELSFDPTTRKVMVTRKDPATMQAPNTPPSKIVQPVTGKVPPDGLREPRTPETTPTDPLSKADQRPEPANLPVPDSPKPKPAPAAKPKK